MRTLKSGHFHGTRRVRNLDGGLTFAETDYAPSHRLPMHAHEQAFFSLVVRGSFAERLETGARECLPVSLVYYAAREPHAEVFGPGGGRAFNVELGAEWLGRLRAHGMSDPRGTSCTSKDEASWLATRLYAAFLGEGTDLELDETVVEILSRMGGNDEGPSEPRAPEWLGRVRELVHARFDEVLRMDELAGEAGVHPAHLTRVFRRHFGCTVAEYQRRLRVHVACMRLAQGESLSAIALRTGFSDQAHFSRRFKQLTGLTPGRYRSLVAA